MKVFVCTFTEHDLDLTGRVFYTLEDAHAALEKSIQLPLYDDDEIRTLNDYLRAGFVSFTETEIEGEQGQLKLEFITTEPNEYGEGAGVELINHSDNDTKLFRVFEGEPEDMIMGRDLSDCLSVDTLVQIGFEAGCTGLDLCIKYTTEGGED